MNIDVVLAASEDKTLIQRMMELYLHDFSVILYIACSLDGYIAGKDGDISWLHPFEQAGEDSRRNPCYALNRFSLLDCSCRHSWWAGGSTLSAT